MLSIRIGCNLPAKRRPCASLQNFNACATVMLIGNDLFASTYFDWDPNNTFVLGADGAGIVEAQGAGRDGSALLRQRTKPCPLSQPAACQILS
jgi:hypothetical protein